MLRIIIALAFFSYASISDWRTRRVKNIIWMALGVLSFVLLLADLMFLRIFQNAGDPVIAESIMLPLAFLFIDVFWEREKDIKKPIGFLAIALYIISFVWISYIGYSVVNGNVAWEDVSGPYVAFCAVIVFEIFYMTDVIKGGADAKALICLAILFPWYPDISSGIPMIVPAVEAVRTFFPFALSVLFMGALVSCAVPIYYLSKNIGGGKKSGLRAFIGFRLPIEEVEKHFVWLMEWVEEGQVRFSYRKPRETETLKADLAALKERGLKEVWVTYKIPFIIPMTIGLLIVIFAGNLLFLFY